MLIEEYRRSLKMPEAEEFFDLIFFRPLAFIIVKLIYRFPVTPNQVTFLSMLGGFVAAWYFSQGDATSLIWGATWYAMANILDCADGQLARLQQSGTLFGRVVDGVADYFSTIAVFAGIGVGLSSAGMSQWWLVVMGGFSSAVHSMAFDYHQSEFMSITNSEDNFLKRELEKFSQEMERLRRTNGSFHKILILKSYLMYLSIQSALSSKRVRTSVDPQRYKRTHSRMIQFWSVLGPTTNRTLLILCALFGRVDLYLWAVVAGGNCWLLLALWFQHRIHRRMIEVDRA